MRLRINAWFEDSTTKMDIPSIKDLQRVLPAFLKNEEDVIKAQILIKQLNSLINKLNTFIS